MATVASLHARQSATVGHLLVVEGLDYMFTDIVDIAGTAWITGGDGRTVLPGLEVPGSLVIESDPRTGLLRENKATFTLLDDSQDRLATLFKSSWGSELERVAQRVRADTVFAADEIIGLPYPTNTTVYGRHIGLERIGSAGERRSYYITPSDIPPGIDHPAIDGGDFSDVPPLYVSDSPYAFAGRKVALYRLVYDPDSATWPSFADQYAGGSLIWVGSMTDRGRMVDVSKFAIECAGPASWCRKTLNGHRNPEWRLVTPSVELTATEQGVGVWFQELLFGGGTTTYFDSDFFNASHDISGSTYQAIADEVRAVVAGTRDDTGGNYANHQATRKYRHAEGTSGGNASFTGSAGSISILEGNAAQNYGMMSICLHAKVWALLGWDPKVQPLLDPNSGKFVEFARFTPTLTFNTTLVTSVAGRTLDWDNYWVGYFYTHNPDITLVPSEGADFGGNTRVFNALYPDGAVTLLPSPQTITVGLDNVYIEGQRGMKASSTEQNSVPQINSIDVDSMGWWAFRGEIARGSSPFDDGVEFEEYTQIARCSWVDNSGQVGTNANSQTALHIELWEDPKAYGIDHSKMVAAWLSGGATQVHCAPLAVLSAGYAGTVSTEPDRAHWVITRTMLSSGTVGEWTPTLLPPPPGDNQPAAANSGGNFFGGDVEIADLGLAIPKAAVDFASFVDCAEKIEGGPAGPLNQSKYAYLGGFQAEDVLSQALSSRGWAFSWKKTATSTHPQWGCYSVFADLSPADTEITLTESDKAGRAGNNRSWISDQEVRYAAPVDEFTIATRSHLIDGGEVGGDKTRSMDREARGRSGRVSYDITDGGLSDPSLMPPNATKWQWEIDWRKTFGEQAGRWYARRNPFVTMTISATQGQYCYPGTVVRVTDPRLLNGDGTYGLTTGMGRVLRTEMILTGALAGSFRLGVVLQQDNLSTQSRTWAPSARVHSWDSTNKILYLTGPWDGDWLGIGGTHVDTLGFSEPSWAGVGGTAKGRLLQSEDGGETWGDAVTFTIGAVDATAKTVVYSSESGTIYRDTDKILIMDDYDTQTANEWVRALFTVHTDGVTGAFGGTDGWRLG